MKNQKGFTLIELLLVLAIIGIISAIAIPALLGQRARARDKSSRGNVSSVMADLIASYDKVKDAGTTVAAGANIIGTAAAPLIPQVFTTVNPWGTTTTGYNFGAWVTETIATPGTATEGQALIGTKGQVQLGYLPPAAGANGVFAASVYLNDTFTIGAATSHNFTQSAGVD